MNSLLSSQLYDNDGFYGTFTKDLQHAKQNVLIESPFITMRRMSDLLPIFHTLRQRDVRMIVNTRDPEEHDTEYRRQAKLAIYDMQQLGVIVLFTARHHRKLAIMDRKILWEGSLNILSQNDSCEIMRRIESKKLAQKMIEFVRIDKFF